MTTYVLQRLSLMVVTLFTIITLTFFLMHAVPGGPFVSDKMMAPEIQAAINAKYHLDDPIWVQYLNYLRGIASFDLGPSFKYPGMSVNQIIAEGLPTTLKVGVLALICVVSLGVPLGIVAALNRNRWPDTLVMVIATIGVAVPSYVIATVALYVFALRLGWVPTFGLDDWRGYFLPVFALSGFWISFIARLARSSLLETLQHGLHDHRQGQGPRSGPDPVQARPAQFADPGGHGAWSRGSPTSSPGRSSSSRSSPCPASAGTSSCRSPTATTPPSWASRSSMPPY